MTDSWTRRLLLGAAAGLAGGAAGTPVLLAADAASGGSVGTADLLRTTVTGLGVGVSAGVLHAAGARMSFPLAAGVTALGSATLSVLVPGSPVREPFGSGPAGRVLTHLAYGAVTKLVVRVVYPG